MDGISDEIEFPISPQLKPLPGEVVVRAPKGTKPFGRTALTHGYHSGDVIEIPTSLMCNVCPLYAVKRKDRRHNLACSEGRKNQICPILMRRQIRWAEELIGEIQSSTGEGPTASDRARIEQIVRHRSRIFQVENYLKVAGLIDLKKGETRNVGDRLIATENALSRSLSEFRQAVESRRTSKPQAPSLAEYLEIKGENNDRSND